MQTTPSWPVVILLSAGCAGNPAPRADPPVLTFRLEWLGAADLDLHVVSPLGKEIWYVDPRSPSGGVLHIDCNVNPENACTEAVETVTWPPGGAPPGTYQYWVRLMHPRETPLPVAFYVYVLRGADVIAERRGEIGAAGDISPKWEVAHSRF